MSPLPRSPGLPFGLLALLLLACAGCGAGPADADGDIDGARVWLDSCSSCHGPYGDGTDYGPDLRLEVGELTVERVRSVAVEGLGSMDPVQLTPDEAQAVAEFVVEQLLLEELASSNRTSFTPTANSEDSTLQGARTHRIPATLQSARASVGPTEAG